MLPTISTITATVSNILSSSKYSNNVLRIGVFGSVARDEATNKSDIDLIIDYQHTDNALNYIYFCSEIEEAFKALYNKTTSIVEAEALNYEEYAHIGKEIEKDAKWIYVKA